MSTPCVLHRLYVLVFIHHDTRRARIAGVAAKPVTDWVPQQARNLRMELTDQASDVKFLIRDRDTKFTASYDAVFAAEGVRVIKTLVRAPRAAVCERVIGTVRRECLDNRRKATARATSSSPHRPSSKRTSK